MARCAQEAMRCMDTHLRFSMDTTTRGLAAQVKLLTGPVPEVSVDFDERTPMAVIKARLEQLTGRW